MDTKSRSYSHSKLMKIVAFLLVVVSFTTMVMIGIKALNENQGKINMVDNPNEKNYYLSTNYGREVTNIINDLIEVSIRYKNEEYIKSGKTIDKEEYKMLKEDLFNQFIDNRNNYKEDNLDEEKYYGDLEKNFEIEFKEEIQEIKNKLIREDLRDFNSAISILNQKKGLVYYVKQGETVLSNTKNNSINDFKKYPAYIVSEAGGYSFSPKEFEHNSYYNSIYANSKENLHQVDQIQIAFTKDYIDGRVSRWNDMKEETKESREIIEQVIYKLLAISLVLLSALIYLIVVTGKESFKTSKLNMNKIDKLYTDINLGFILGIISIWVLITFRLGTMNRLTSDLSFIFIAIISAIASGLVLELLLSLVRHVKNKSIFSYALTFIVIRKIYRVVKDIYDSGGVAIKVAVAVIVYPILAVITVFFFPVIIGIAVYLAHRKVKEYMEIKDGVEKIKNGEIDHKINIEGSGEFKNLAEDINTIGEGFNSAIENELKSERLKTELITNVSHDIRTPLTSIITYIDLIKNEKDKTKINEYIKVIEQKSNRLKILTDDLFEASKATSGNIPVSLEKIDIVSLITQGLGELDSQVQESELDFKINNFAEKIYVNADGRLLWRAMENLFTNIFKYSLKGSRVYVDIVDLEEKIELSIKNISAYELNISSDELLERFKRGDESRGSEGSGLGLSISKSLIEAQDGEFEILIDGDLFKVVITLLKI